MAKSYHYFDSLTQKHGNADWFSQLFSDLVKTCGEPTHTIGLSSQNRIKKGRKLCVLFFGTRMVAIWDYHQKGEATMCFENEVWSAAIKAGVAPKHQEIDELFGALFTNHSEATSSSSPTAMNMSWVQPSEFSEMFPPIQKIEEHPTDFNSGIRSFAMGAHSTVALLENVTLTVTKTTAGTSTSNIPATVNF